MKKFIKNNKLAVVTFIICAIFVILVFAVTALISWLVYKRKRVMDMLLYSFIFLDAIYMGKVLSQAILLYNVDADFTKISSAEQLIVKLL